MKQTEILTHATHVNGWFPAVYMSCMSPNFRLFHVSNLSVRNFRIFLLMYTGSAGLWSHSRDEGRLNTGPHLCRLARIVEQRNGVRKLAKHFEINAVRIFGSLLRSPGKIPKFSKRFLDDTTFNFKGRATILIPSYASSRRVNHVILTLKGHQI